MILKVFKAIWFLSLIAFLIVFTYEYASLPALVTVLERETPLMISRDAVFYTFIALAAFVNMLVFVVRRLFPETAEDFKSWFYGLVIALNLYLLVGVSFISLYNSTEKFDYERIGIIIYGSVGLIVVWTAGWPIYWLYKKYFSKQAV